MLFPHLYLEITSKCNLSCNHCCIGKKEYTELTSIKKLLKEFSQKGGKFITISGGEPLLREDWYQISKLSVDLGIKTTLFTNGTLIEKNLDLIMDLSLNIAISIDGITEYMNDIHRGSKSYLKTMKGINILLNNGLENNLTISFTPTSKNLGEIKGLVEFCLFHRIKHFHISFLEYRGNARINKDLQLSIQEKIELMKELFSYSRNYKDHLIINLSESRDLFYNTFNFGKNLLKTPLGKTLKITSEGLVYTNPFVEGEFFLIGTYPSQTLNEILESPKIELISKYIRERPQKIAKCRRCFYNPICSAGSYALVYNKYGSIWFPDDYCQANQAIFKKFLKELVKK